MSEKQEEALKVVKAINRRKKKLRPDDNRPAVFVAGDRPDLLTPQVFSTGIVALDTILHGGIKAGSSTVFSGKPGSCKTGTALSIIAAVQKADADAVCVYVNAEESFPLDVAKIVGVDIDKVLVIDNFEYAEEGLDQILSLLWDNDKKSPRNIVSIIVIDSVAALVPKAEEDKVQEEGMESLTIGQHAKMMSKFNRILHSKQGTAAVVYINQLRQDINSYGGGEVQTGGKTMGYDPKVHLNFTSPKSKLLTEGTGVNKKVVGQTVCIRTVKNNAGLGGHMGEQAEYEVRYHVGIDNVKPAVLAAIAAGIIEEPGRGYYIIGKELGEHLLTTHNLVTETGPVKIHGIESLTNVFRDNKDMYAALQRVLNLPADEKISKETLDEEPSVKIVS